ncbi:MAG: pyruvate carboxylase, partial [Clostridia bacterium]|nr:pyruvate carboxylase [Clostridia bacterium]
MEKHIKRVLVANRGEIAIRVFRACYDLGLRTIAIYSKEDIFNLFRTKADEAYQIDAKSPLGAYLDIDAIINLAKQKGADAIHPGYGFLSENADFARACEENGITFIGPTSDILEKMGDKLNAKEIALECGVPTIPGSTEPLRGVEDALARADSYGYPVILKAAAGGGGRGMRRVDSPDEMSGALDMVTSESVKAFGSSSIFMEKYLEDPKHIEVQILADKYGNYVHLYERDCSLQRRYQKVVEYTPAFSLPEALRSRLHEDALKIARHVGYVSAGTVEFLVDRHGNHYFIEMNPRIQVEHTVTEEVTGVDIVRAQILIADGESLDSDLIGVGKQEDITCRGCAIQCRVTTEDPANNFAPDTGKVTLYRSGGGAGVRLDAGNAFTGAEISPYYDSLLVKITTHDSTFRGAARKALRSVQEVRIRGVKTNVPFLTNILKNETFNEGLCTTQFIDSTPSLFVFKEEGDRATKLLRRIGEIIVNERSDDAPKLERPVIPYVSGPVPDGLKQILDASGPEAVKKWVLDQKKLLITDTTFRDAHQSLLATRVRTRDLLAIAPKTARAEAGLFSMEMWGGATFDVAFRYLREDPWERLRLLREAMPNILFQMLLRGSNAVGYANYPDNFIRDFVREVAASGIDVIRVFDSLNWVPGMEIAMDEALKTGKLVEATICYTGDVLDDRRDKYSLKYYVNLAKELERRGAHILAIKDMAGLLKPYAAKKLVSALKNELSIPVELHTHDTSGNQVATVLMAAEAGVDIADLAISSMSSLTSQPSLNTVVAALAG